MNNHDKPESNSRAEGNVARILCERIKLAMKNTGREFQVGRDPDGYVIEHRYKRGGAMSPWYTLGWYSDLTEGKGGVLLRGGEPVHSFGVYITLTAV